MPCYRCGTRQVDPDRGASPWARGVIHGHQVLVCPDCQVAQDWTADLDRCARCGSARLVRRLDELECRDCGLIRVAAGEPASGTADGPASPAASGADPRLAEEVERALRKVFGRAFQPAGWADVGTDAAWDDATKETVPPGGDVRQQQPYPGA